MKSILSLLGSVALVGAIGILFVRRCQSNDEVARRETQLSQDLEQVSDRRKAQSLLGTPVTEPDDGSFVKRDAATPLRLGDVLYRPYRSPGTGAAMEHAGMVIGLNDDTVELASFPRRAPGEPPRLHVDMDTSKPMHIRMGMTDVSRVPRAELTEYWMRNPELMK